jgi:anaerobic ribonucleoside-triphosphate reductase activating protein
MYYGNIKNCDIADGLGVRVSLFVSGCRNCCKGCFNEMTWDFKFGKEFTKETEEYILKLLEPAYIDGFTLLGGEPFEEENQEPLAELLKKIKETYPNKDIWCYTGYILEKDLLPEDGRKHTKHTKEMLDCIDVLVDGPFIQEQKNLMLKFRGSKNQRVIDLKSTLKEGKIIIFID